MKIAEVLLQDFDTEIANTRRTLERVQEDRSAWVPHERSMPLGKLAMHCATIPMFGHYILEDDGMDMAASTRIRIPLVFESRDACLEHLKNAAEKCRASLVSASDERMIAPWRFSFGEQVISEQTRSETFRRMFFNHMVHHVAQLGVYLRLNDVPVPALYGPSADEQWTAPK